MIGCLKDQDDMVLIVFWFQDDEDGVDDNADS